MADFEGMAQALQIPQKVINNIDAIDKKINQIASDSEKMATHFMSAMQRMGDGSGTLLQRLTEIQSIFKALGGTKSVGIDKVSSGIKNVATEGEKAASSVTTAAEALNKFSKAWRELGGRPQVAKSFEILTNREQMNILKEARNQADAYSRSLTEANRRNIAGSRESANAIKEQMQAEKNRHNEKMSQLKRESSSTRLESSAYRDYISAITMSEQTENSRIKKIERMNTVLAELRRNESNYATAIEALTRKINSLTKENERLAASRANSASSLARQARLDSKLRRSNYTDYVTSTEGSLRTAGRATNYNQRAQAIKNLEAAIKRLNSTDKDYQNNLSRLSAAHKKLIEEQKQVESAYRQVQQSQRHLMDTSGQLQRALAAIFSVSAIEGYINKLVAVRGEFELQNTALASILGNKEQADKLFGQITQLAVQSPFTVKELTTYTKSLAAYSVEYKDLYKTTKMLADVSSGLGVDMQRLILAFGQVKAANFLRGTETRQFTEAGINMLGELAKYYSELEGRIVSVSEVQDRQFKRMISFEDVAEVFKRLTSEGGMFYNMQERQAETLAGLMSNLQDRIDLMLNSLGQENEEMIKGVVKALGSLISNYETVANVIKVAGGAFVLFKLNALASSDAVRRLAVQVLTFNGTIPKTLSLVQLFQVGMFKLTTSLRAAGVAMKTFLATNWPVLAITGLIAAIYELIHWNDEYNEQLKEINARHNEQVVSLNRVTKAYKKAADAAKEVPELTADSDAYKEQLNQLNELYSMMEERGYKVPVEIEYVTPENINDAFAQGSALLKQGSEFGQALRAEIARGMTDSELGGLIGENLKSDLEDLGNAYSKVDGAFKVTLNTIQNAFLASEKLPESAQKYVEELEAGQKANEDDYHWTMRRLSLVQAINKETNGYLGVVTGYNSELNKLLATANEIGTQERETAYELDKVFDRLIRDYGGLDKLKKAYAENPILIQTEIDQAFESLQLNAQAERFAQFWAAQRLQIPFEWKEKEEVTGPQFFNDFRDSVQELDTTGIFRGMLKDMRSLEDLENAIQKKYKERSEELEVLQRANTKNLDLTKQIAKYQEQLLSPDAEIAANARAKVEALTKQKQLTEEQRKSSIEFAQTELQSLRNIANAYNLRYQEPKKTGSRSKKDPELEKLKEQISLIEKAQKEYQKYQKLYDDTTAQDMTGKAFEQAFNDLGLNFDINFEPSGIIEAFKKLMESVGDEGDKLLNERIAVQTTGVTEKQRTQQIEEYREEIDKLFDSYENFQELEKLGLPKNTISQLFGIDVSSLNDVDSNLSKIIEALKKYGEEGEKVIEDAEKRITDAQQKELDERLKKYAEYIATATSKILQVQNKGAEFINGAKDLFNEGKISAEEYTSIIKHTVDSVNSDVSKIRLDEFKKSPEYMRAMGDMALYSKNELDKLYNSLKKTISANSKDMKPDELKAYMTAIGNVKKEIDKVENPFKALASSMDDGIVKLIAFKDVQEKFNIEQQKYNELLKQKQDLELQRQVEQGKLASLKSFQEQNPDIDMSGAIASSQGNIENITSMISGVEGLLGQSQASMSALSGQASGFLGGMSQAMFVIDQVVKAVDNTIQNVVKGFNEVKELADTFGAETDEGKWKSWTIAMDSISEMSSNVKGSWESFKNGDFVGASIQATAAIFSVIKGINRIHDNKLETKIQKEIELVEDLERGYKKIEKAIDEAYSLDTYDKAYDNAVANIEQQKAALQRNIALESDKKDTDDERIKEWQNQIEDLNEQLDELKEQAFSQYTGGIFDDLISAAENFTNAWLDAFLETGNGLKGLEDNFVDFFKTLLIRQAAMSLITPYLNKAEEKLKQYVNENDSELTTSEGQQFADYMNQLFPQMSENLENFFTPFQDMLKSAEDAGDSLTGLQKGIQGITEDTAEVLASIVESIRFYVGQTYTAIESIRSWIFSPPSESPLYREMVAQTEQLRLLYSLVNSTTKTKTGIAGRVIKVEIV